MYAISIHPLQKLALVVAPVVPELAWASLQGQCGTSIKARDDEEDLGNLDAVITRSASEVDCYCAKPCARIWFANLARTFVCQPCAGGLKQHKVRTRTPLKGKLPCVERCGGSFLFSFSSGAACEQQAKLSLVNLGFPWLT